MAQTVASGEENIFSFVTKTGKTVSLSKEKNNCYIVYRFGTKSKIEFEFPGKNQESWKQFKYSFYLRGGGADNEGMDLNYFYFENKGFRYLIYDCYYSAGNKKETGIKITHLATGKTTDLKGNIKTRKGTLVDFRDNALVEITEEMFD